MKVLLSKIPINEEIHKVDKDRFVEVISKVSPDFIFIVTGEALSIHSHIISELHMFEYGNVRYAVWNLIEDILFRLEDLPEYHISVYPVTGEYRCKETGYHGIFEGVEHPLGYIQYEFARKMLELDLGQKIEYILYSNNGFDNLLLWEALKGLINIDAIAYDDVKIYLMNNGTIELRSLMHPYINIGWREVKPNYGLRDDELGFIKILAYTIDNGFLEIIREGNVRKKLIEGVDDILSKLEYIFYSSTTSDREGYLLKVSHGRDIGVILSSAAMIKYFLERLETMSMDKIENLPVNCIGEEATKVLDQINKELLGDSKNLVDTMFQEEFLQRFAECFR